MSTHSDVSAYHSLAQMSEWVKEIKDAKDRRDFMLGFANDPVNFIQKWIVSQHKDLKVCVFSDSRD